MTVPVFSQFREGNLVEPIPERDRMALFSHPRFAHGPFKVQEVLPPVIHDGFSDARLIVEDQKGNVVRNVSDDNPATIADWYFRKVVV